MTHQKSKIFLLGGDLSTSKSFIMQNTIYKHFDLPFEYCMCSIDTEAKLATFVKEQLNESFFVANVTYPYKHEVLKLDEIQNFDECCKFCEGTNLILSNGQTMSAFNYDGPGLAMFLSKNNIEIKSKCALIFGTGITARSIAFALNSLGANKFVFVSRDKTKAHEFCLKYEHKFAELDTCFAANTYDKLNANFSAITYDKLDQYLKKADFVINATPMGKFADIKDANPMEDCVFESSQCAIDVVYSQGLTPFLMQAKNSGCQVFDGTYMLAAQAALSVLKIVDYFGEWLHETHKITKQVLNENNLNFDNIFEVAHNAIVAGQQK